MYATASQDSDHSHANERRFEILLFRLGKCMNEGLTSAGQSEVFGVNVLKVREIVAVPAITPIAGGPRTSLGVVHLRGQVIPVQDLPTIVGYQLPEAPKLMLVAEFSGTTQAFVVESVDDIVVVDWQDVIPAESSGTEQRMVTGLVRLPTEDGGTRLAQILDVEAILQEVTPETSRPKIDSRVVGGKLHLPAGQIVLVADDSFVARALMEQTLKALELPYEIVKSGSEAWNRLEAIAASAQAEGQTIHDRVSLVLTDLEMPEMDGFTLTRNIRQDARFASLPVVVHSSLSGTANENHARSVGATDYVAKFAPEELASTLRKVLQKS